MKLALLLFCNPIYIIPKKRLKLVYQNSNCIFALKKRKMILPIVAYGDPVLRKKSEEISKEYPNLQELIANMKETMYNASGVGLAAPQIGKAIRLFIIDASPFADDDDLTKEENEVLKNFNRVFINPKIIKEEGDEWSFNEGCLSIPEIREDVWRQPTITIEYQDEQFEKHTEILSGLAARIFQHEYDHIEGVLFTDRISSLKKRLLKKKLENISKGKIKADYRMRFPN
jgi:peptide deformylase